MVHAIHLVFINIRAHQTMIEEERKQHIEFKATQWPKKGNATTTFVKTVKRHALKKRTKK